MAKYLDQTGLEHFWGKIKTYIQGSVSKIAYTNEDLLDTTGTVQSALDMLVQTANDYTSHNHDNIYVPLGRTIAGLNLNNNIDAGDLTSKLTNATSSANGLMSKGDYSKLSALPTNAELEETYFKKQDMSSIYKASGSITPSDGKIVNPTSYLTANHLGNVYHLTSEFTTDQYFITPEAGKNYPAGTNIVVVEVEGWQDNDGSNYNFKFDILSGFVDLSNYATKDDLDDITITVETISNAEIDTIVAS